MDSKYKARAEKLLEFVEYSVKSTNGMYSHLDAMLELADEVEAQFEHKAVNMYMNTIAKTELYTKKQVDEFLRKQRELCAQNADIKDISRFQFKIDKDSIRNAIYNID
jgi:hypothetical protein